MRTPAVSARSSFRDVPDNQEVFADAATDQSVIIELLERSDDVADDALLAHVFSDLVEPEDTASLSVTAHLDAAVVAPALAQSCERISAAAPLVVTASGLQHVAKFKESERNTVKIMLAAVRLADVATDILITMNVPTRITPGTSSAASVDARVVDSDGNVAADVIASADAVLQALLASLRIDDWGLFGS